MKPSPQSLHNLRNRLPIGYQKTAMRRLRNKYSQPYISMVAHGHRFNEQVLNTLAKLADEQDAKRTALEGQLAGTIIPA